MRWVAIVMVVVGFPLLASAAPSENRTEHGASASPVSRPRKPPFSGALETLCSTPHDEATRTRLRAEAARRFRWAEFLYRNTEFAFRNPATLLPDMRRMIADLRRLNAAYAAVLDAGDSELAIAALVRLAEVPSRVGHAILTAPVPNRVDRDDEGTTFIDPEEPAVLEFPEPTLEYAERALDLAARCHVENAFTARARELAKSGPQDRSPPPSGEGRVGEKANGAAGSP